MSYMKIPPMDEEANKRSPNTSYDSFAGAQSETEHFNEDLNPEQGKSFALFKKLSVAAVSTIVVIACVASFSTFKSSSSANIMKSTTPSKASGSAASTSNPNFVFILADDVGWNSLGYENYDLDFATPFMTKLAMNGIILKNYYSQEVCTPARAALMTGRYPASVGMQYGEIMPTENLALEITETLLPEIMKKNGYTTYGIGKWNLGHYNPQYLPTARGFDYFLGYMDGHNYYWSKRDPGATSYYDFMYMDTDCYNLYDGDDMTEYSTTLYKNKALDVIDTHDFDSGPMFLYLPVQAAHDPFADYQDSYPDGLNSSYVGETRYTEVTENVVGEKRQQYAMALMMLDDMVSDIHEALEDQDQLKNTYIIFASDNGGCYQAGGRNGPLRGSKGSLFEGGTKVDAFVYSPILSDSAGTHYTGLMHVSDWFSTITSWAGISYTASAGYELDSVDHSKTIMGASGDDDDDALASRSYMLYNIYLDVSGEDFDITTNAPFAIRNTQYKLMHAYVGNAQSKWYSYNTAIDDDGDIDDVSSCSQSTSCTGTYTKFLFDLVNDPFETTNLYYNSSYESIKEELYSQVGKTTVKEESSYFSSEDAYTQWDANSYFIQPWNFTELVTSSDTSSYPSLCTSDTIFSPTYSGRRSKRTRRAKRT